MTAGSCLVKAQRDALIAGGAEPGSLTEVTGRFPWSSLQVYDVNAAGQNHGLLLATPGWSVT